MRPEESGDGIKLHVGGRQVKQGWRILNIQPGPGVDYVGSCVDLSFIDDGAVKEIYASHVLEHLSYRYELPEALAEFYRVLSVGGKVLISVPDLDVLTRIYLDKEVSFNERWLAVTMMFGGHKDEHDVHKTGANFELMRVWLERAGFVDVNRVDSFDYFDDSSRTQLHGKDISLNVVATKRGV